jgi:tRNA dimethylallyltransferase
MKRNGNSNYVIIIAGPTASGKTAVSIELSKLLDIEVISADSRQIYKYMNIGTATPDDKELSAVKTYFINMIDPDQYYSAGRFGDDAFELVNEIFTNGKIPVVVGGSGLYIKALCEGFFDEKINLKNRNIVLSDLIKLLDNKGIEYIYEELKYVDPVSAEKYKDMNPRRFIRALEYYKLTGIPFSEAQKKYNKERNLNCLYFGIDVERKVLYDRINKRAEYMWNNGLLDETDKILSMEYSKFLNSLNTVGYKEAIAFLEGEMTELEALKEMKKNTRRYAKRQMTWFRKVPNIIWLDGSDEEIAKKIMKKYIEFMS